jgi:serine/threonine protein kinase
VEISETKLGDLGTMSGIDAGSGSDEVVLPAGKVVADRFEIIGFVGRGGMGTVYEVYDQMRDERVALKFLRPELVSSDNARQRFLNEAKIAISLSHPHIISVFDVVKYLNTCFLTMELLKGQSLRERLQELAKSGQQMPLDEALRITRDVAEALAYAHKSTVHRDIKPENIWILPDGSAKLMDFGIARLQDQSSNLTKTTSVLGTAYYMAPEQLVGAGQVDHRADQYSLGVLLYEMLTGRLPIGKAKPVRELRPHISKAVDAVIETMLAGSANDRYPNDADCLQALNALQTSEKPSSLGKIAAIAAGVAVIGLGLGYFMTRPASLPITEPVTATENEASFPTPEAAPEPAVKLEPVVPAVANKPAPVSIAKPVPVAPLTPVPKQASLPPAAPASTPAVAQTTTQLAKPAPAAQAEPNNNTEENNSEPIALPRRSSNSGSDLFRDTLKEMVGR